MKSSKVNEKYRKYIRNQECCMCRKGPPWTPITSTSHNCEEKIEGQIRNGGESPRQPEPNPIVSELPPVRSAPSGREKVLEKKKGRPIRDSQLLLAGISKVKCVMKHSKYCLEYFIPEGKFNKICKNCKQTHMFRSAV